MDGSGAELRSGEGADSLVLNPGFRLHIGYSSRRKDMPVASGALDLRRHRALVRWLLDLMDASGDLPPAAGAPLPEAVRVAGEELGALLPSSEIPAEPIAFRGCPDDDTLALIPGNTAYIVHRRTPALHALSLNPHCAIQTDTALPAAVRDRVALGADLYGHLGHDFKPPVADRFSDERPVVWVEDPTTGMVEPVWLGPWTQVVRDAFDGNIALSEIPLPALRAMRLANLLIDTNPGRLDGARAEFESGKRSMLERHGYFVCRQAFSPLMIAATRRHLHQLRRAGAFRLDRSQVKDMRESVYCDPLTLYLQHQFGRMLNRVMKDPVIPTYTISTRYYRGARLERHTDRPQCKWNVSLCVDIEPDGGGDRCWPLYLDVGGTPHEIRLDVGDAVVYSGTDTPHWRDELVTSDSVSVCFFHYVRSGFSGPRR